MSQSLPQPDSTPTPVQPDATAPVSPQPQTSPPAEATAAPMAESVAAGVPADVPVAQPPAPETVAEPPVTTAIPPPPPPWFSQGSGEVPISPDDISAVHAEMAKPERVLPPSPRMSPAPAKKKSTRPDLASRGLILIWCFWLLGSWGVSTGLESSLPAIRWMIFSAMLGMLLVWPMLRLSQEHPKSANSPSPTIFGSLESGTPMTPGAVFSDWLSLNLVFQLVVWILRLSARWSIDQAGWLALAMASWSLIVAALLIIGCKSDRGHRRTIVMGICILLFLGEPAVLALLNTFQAPQHAFNWPLSISPLQAIWVMSGPTSGWESHIWAPRIKIVALVALTLWLGVLITSRREKARG